MTVRRINYDKDLLKVMKAVREAKGITMEQLSEMAGVCDRYYNKVEIGIDSDDIRAARAEIYGRPPPKHNTVRRPFQMRTSMSWMLEALGLCLVVMPLDMAYQMIEPDPVSDVQMKRLKDAA